MLKTLKTYLGMATAASEGDDDQAGFSPEEAEIRQLISDSDSLLEKAARSAMQIKNYSLSANLSEIRRLLILERRCLSSENQEFRERKNFQLQAGVDRAYGYAEQPATPNDNE